MRIILPLVTICFSIISFLILLKCIESGKYNRESFEDELSKNSKKDNKLKKEITNSEISESKNKVEKNAIEKEYELKQNKKDGIEEKYSLKENIGEKDGSLSSDKKIAAIYSLIMSVILLGFSIWFYFTDINLFYAVKLMALLSIMWPISLTDIKWYAIPNKFILFGIICRLIIIPFEFMVQGFDFLKAQILSELIASAIIVIPCIIFFFVSKNSIGAGDIKLFFLMGLFLGTENIWNAMFLSLIISFLVSLFCLLTKKKGRKDVIPMGPSIAIGTLLTIIMVGI